MNNPVQFKHSTIINPTTFEQYIGVKCAIPIVLDDDQMRFVLDNNRTEDRTAVSKNIAKHYKQYLPIIMEEHQEKMNPPYNNSDLQGKMNVRHQFNDTNPNITYLVLKFNVPLENILLGNHLPTWYPDQAARWLCVVMEHYLEDLVRLYNTNHRWRPDD
jgi:hypothetical protein